MGVEELAYEQAKDRNEGREPDELHLAYERERIRLLAESDVFVAVVGQWNAGAPAARRARQDKLRAWWPALGMALDAATGVVRGRPGATYDVAAAEARSGRRGLLDSGPHAPVRKGKGIASGWADEEDYGPRYT